MWQRFASLSCVEHKKEESVQRESFHTRTRAKTCLSCDGLKDKKRFGEKDIKSDLLGLGILFAYKKNLSQFLCFTESVFLMSVLINGQDNTASFVCSSC